MNETVVGAESVTALSATPNPAIAGQTVYFTATVKAAQGSVIPTGTVIFTDGTVTLATATLNASGTAAFSTATLAPGTHTIAAIYSGEANFNPSSASVTEIITVVATTNSLTATPQSGRLWPDGHADRDCTCNEHGSFTSRSGRLSGRRQRYRHGNVERGRSRELQHLHTCCWHA